MGDILPSGCKYLIENNKDFSDILKQGISIVMASHHGLESGYCQEFYNLLPNNKIRSVHVISDKIKINNQDGNTEKRYLSSSLAEGYNNKYSYSTKNDGHIRIVLGGKDKIDISTSHNINDLLE